MTVPSVPGVLTDAHVRQTAASIALAQEPSGAIPWSPGEHVDIWNHVEAAMGLLVGGEVDAAERALNWVPTMQRADGSWPIKIVLGEVVDDRGECNVSAYFAVGLWHHWLIRRDRSFVEQHWDSVRRGLDWVTSLQVPFGGIQWTPVDDLCLLAGGSSIFQSLRAGLALADLMGEAQPEWELAAGRLGHAVRNHRDLFADKSTFSMDWYYPVLGGAVRGHDGLDLLAQRWPDFVTPGYGARCVDHKPWITGAETCELVMALDALDDHDRALQLFTDMQRLRHPSGGYWTGVVYGDADQGDVFWPGNLETYTAAAVILAADALATTYGTGTAGAGIMRADSLPSVPDLPMECDCVLATSRR
jgi:hypothetical protein